MRMKICLLTTCAMVLVSAGIAVADQPELPPLKEGLWESHTTMVIQSAKHESVLKVCRTHQTDKAVKDQSKAIGENLRKVRQCTDTTTQQSAGSYSSEAHCLKDGSVTKTTVTFQGDTSYHMEMHRKDNQSESVTTIDDKYVGSCPADMKPGDAIMGDGKRFNLIAP
jgi:uncharacterized membrane protein YhiD involved in acid resistance